MTPRMSSLSGAFIGLILIAAAGCDHAQDPQKSPEGNSQSPVMKDVSVAEFHKLMASMPDALLLDVRTPEEWDEGHLEGAAHHDYWGDEAAFEQAMNRIPRDRPVLVYCAGGGRSGLTAKELNADGHQEVYNLEDGITGWKREGMPVVTGPPAND